jgi:hypothetical protein
MLVVNSLMSPLAIKQVVIEQSTLFGTVEAQRSNMQSAICFSFRESVSFPQNVCMGEGCTHRQCSCRDALQNEWAFWWCEYYFCWLFMVSNVTDRQTNRRTWYVVSVSQSEWKCMLDSRYTLGYLSCGFDEDCEAIMKFCAWTWALFKIITLSCSWFMP